MLKLVSIVLILALAHTSYSQSVLQNACQYIIEESAIYNLLDFASLKPKEIAVKGNLDVSKFYFLTYHMCTRQVPACGVSKEQETLIKNLVYGKLEVKDSKGSTTCQNVTTPNDERKVIPSFLDEDNSTAGIKLTFPETSSGDDKFTLIAELACDNKVSANEVIWTATFFDSEESLQSNKKTIVLRGAGKSGCPLITMESYLSFYKKYKIIFTLVFITIGLLALTVGYRFFHVTLFVLTTSISSSIAFVFFIMVLAGEASTRTKWILFGVSLAIGLFMGYIVIKVKKLGFFSIGFYFGAIGAVFLYSFLLHFLQLSEGMLMLCIISMAFIGGVLALWLYKDIIILATSCIGSYFVMRAISFHLGGFPSELQVIRGLTGFNYKAYAYLLTIILLAIFGIIRQFKRKKIQEEQSEDYHREPSIAQF